MINKYKYVVETIMISSFFFFISVIPANAADVVWCRDCEGSSYTPGTGGYKPDCPDKVDTWVIGTCTVVSPSAVCVKQYYSTTRTTPYTLTITQEDIDYCLALKQLCLSEFSEAYCNALIYNPCLNSKSFCQAGTPVYSGSEYGCWTTW
ncbi:MAG: hypothetical protein KAS32_00835 [Candidatus Peribacteraceae bacterium]|nr:hypothetical protein [Candidatus Peribacteraceae bacterium]